MEPWYMETRANTNVLSVIYFDPSPQRPTRSTQKGSSAVEMCVSFCCVPTQGLSGKFKSCRLFGVVLFDPPHPRKAFIPLTAAGPPGYTRTQLRRIRCAGCTSKAPQAGPSCPLSKEPFAVISDKDLACQKLKSLAAPTCTSWPPEPWPHWSGIAGSASASPTSSMA